jgi:hypothetical protein
MVLTGQGVMKIGIVKLLMVWSGHAVVHMSQVVVHMSQAVVYMDQLHKMSVVYEIH